MTTGSIAAARPWTDPVRPSTRRIKIFGDVLRATDRAGVGERHLVIHVGSGHPESVRVEFGDKVGASVLRRPDSRIDRTLAFDIPDRATTFRVVVGRSYAAARRLRPGGLTRARVDVCARRWSGLRYAIGVDRLPAWAVRVQPLGDGRDTA